MAQPVIRAATERDMPGMFEIFYLNEMRGVVDPPPRGAVPAWVGHVLATGDVLVAERGDELLGFAGLTTRSDIAFLTDLFVRPGAQSAGIGRALLRAILPTGGRIACTMASSDPRALALYIRAGMVPQWPNFWLIGESSVLRLPEDSVEVVAAEPEDAELLRWDRAIAGRERPQDHRFWVAGQAGIPLWFRRDGQAVGYGYSRAAASLPWQREALTLGPIGAQMPDDALACALAAVRWGRERASLLRLAVPGPHPALRPLLDAGFRIADFDTFASTANASFFDPRCYLSTGGETF